MVGPGQSSYHEQLEDAENLLKIIRMLVAYRKEKKISQAELARRMGTAQSHISDLESGKVQVRSETLERWAAALGLRLAFVVYGPNDELIDQFVSRSSGSR